MENIFLIISLLILSCSSSVNLLMHSAKSWADCHALAMKPKWLWKLIDCMILTIKDHIIFYRKQKKLTISINTSTFSYIDLFLNARASLYSIESQMTRCFRSLWQYLSIQFVLTSCKGSGFNRGSTQILTSFNCESCKYQMK